jgi:hypothetical protein
MCYLIDIFKCYILMYINLLCHQPCAQLFLSKRNIMNYILIFGFASELDKSIHVSVLSVWCIHMFVDGLLNVKRVLQSVA